jgi:hypothetical protein
MPLLGGALVALTLAGAAHSGAAQNAPPIRFGGLVRDPAGTPIPYAQVNLEKAGQRITNDQGRFEVPIREKGRIPVEIRRIGFRPLRFSVELVADTSISVVMHPVAMELNEVRIEADAIVKSLEIRGFYRRLEERTNGLGSAHFITPEDIEARRVTRVTQYLDGIPGVRVVPYGGDWTGRRFAIVSNSRCPMTVYLNGSRLNRHARPGMADPEPPMLDEAITETTVGGIEVNTRNNAPTEYQSMAGTCGVVLVWTK